MNPMQLISQIMNNPNIANNPIANNAMNMYRNNDINGLQKLATNVCKERGIDINQQIDNIKRQFNL